MRPYDVITRNARIELTLRCWCKVCKCYATECKTPALHALKHFHRTGAAK